MRPLATFGPVETGGQVASAYFAFGQAPAGQVITIDFDHHLHQIPVSSYGVWAFIKISSSPGHPGFPFPAA